MSRRPWYSTIRRSAVFALLSSALVVGCDAAAPGDAAPGPGGPDAGKGDCATCNERVACAEEPTLAGITTPLFRGVDAPHRYFAAPTQWVSEDARGTYWLASSFQYFSPSDIPAFDRFSFQTSVALVNADSDAAILEALRALDPEATLARLPLSQSSLDELSLALASQAETTSFASWDAANLTADFDHALSREDLEAATVFHARGLGVLRVAAHLRFSCTDDNGEARVRDLYPQAGATSVKVAFDGVAIDSSPGDLANVADQIMLHAHTILPIYYPDAPLPSADIEALVRPLLTWTSDVDDADVRAMGEAVSDIVEPWADALVAAGESGVDAHLEGMRFQIRQLVAFTPHVRVHALEL